MSKTPNSTSRDTADWIRVQADEVAVRDGCFFDPVTGGFAIWWIERYCRLYEGDYAGQPMHLRGAHSLPIDHWRIPDKYDEGLAIDRARDHCTRYRNGEALDWQYECLMRIFGWQRWSTELRRNIRRFRKGSIWVPKKNKKSPTAAAVALYLLCGDGEEGQKVFPGAKDGAQAREIIGQHCKAMVQASPELVADCKINLNEMSIEHLPTRSKLKPMSSSGSRSQEAKEGLNGSVIIDETHVVDEPFIRRIAKAGISRSEPLFIEFSTAGNNPEGYGKKSFDYGRRVNSGAEKNVTYFFAEYCVPDQVTDQEIKSDPVRFGKLANPAWGHTIRESEYLSDFQESQRSNQDWLDFLMYRLNRWQHSANPWLKAGAWNACRLEMTHAELERQLEGRHCYAGADFSKSRDMTSVQLFFPRYDQEGHLCGDVLSYFWLPEEYARENQGKARFFEWESRGLITLTPGDTIDIGGIYGSLAELSRRYQIVELGYDTAYGEALTQSVEQGAIVAGVEIPGLGIPRVAVPQTPKLLAGPLEELESMVYLKTICHADHPVMNWCMNNVKVTNRGGLRKIEKPDKDSVEKIDGVAALINAVARAMVGPDKPIPDYYETNPVEFF